MVGDFFALILYPALAFDLEALGLHIDLQVIGLDTRQFRGDGESLIVLKYIDRRIDSGRRGDVALPEKLVEELIDFLAQLAEAGLESG